MHLTTWESARIVAQAHADNRQLTFYAFEEWDGTVAVVTSYPRSGIEFETFSPSPAPTDTDEDERPDTCPKNIDPRDPAYRPGHDYDDSLRCRRCRYVQGQENYE